ncbi:unnamed protein product [Thlaspi arvense]|uniref:Uncharacterized protein n=1 Tax=Thlaspi arvense TaxID=13288 RepID=A0AAU9RXH2_THLAR|nr:unnamed protein product [Thlaspi arvense]
MQGVEDTRGNKFHMSLGLPVVATTNCADNTVAGTCTARPGAERTVSTKVSIERKVRVARGFVFLRRLKVWKHEAACSSGSPEITCSKLASNVRMSGL